LQAHPEAHAEARPDAIASIRTRQNSAFWPRVLAVLFDNDLPVEALVELRPAFVIEEQEGAELCLQLRRYHRRLVGNRIDLPVQRRDLRFGIRPYGFVNFLLFKARGQRADLLFKSFDLSQFVIGERRLLNCHAPQPLGRGILSA
jgi:hypothetical protein